MNVEGNVYQLCLCICVHDEAVKGVQFAPVDIP